MLAGIPWAVSIIARLEGATRQPARGDGVEDSVLRPGRSPAGRPQGRRARDGAQKVAHDAIHDRRKLARFSQPRFPHRVLPDLDVKQLAIRHDATNGNTVKFGPKLHGRLHHAHAAVQSRECHAQVVDQARQRRIGDDLSEARGWRRHVGKRSSVPRRQGGSRARPCIDAPVSIRGPLPSGGVDR